MLQNYQVTPELRNDVTTILSARKYAEVSVPMGLIIKSVLTEDEINIIINIIAKYPYLEVFSWFDKIRNGDYLIKLEEPNRQLIEEAIAKPSEIGKSKPSKV